ncbi:MAG: hypothetical protein ABIH42_04275 [Planctomycetota bacterium]
MKEMRLRGISNSEEANEFLKEYLPKHNRMFAIAPEERDDLHRRLPLGTDIERVLCIKSERVLRNDFTVSYENKIYQIEERISAKKAVVEERINGKIVIRYKGAALRYREIETMPKVEKEPQTIVLRKRWKPPVDHPWRNNFKRREGAKVDKQKGRLLAQAGC